AAVLSTLCSVPSTASLSQIAAQFLLPLDRLEQRAEVALAEALGTLTLDDLVENSGAVLHRLREDLQQVTVGIAINQDAELRQLLNRLIDLPYPFLQLLIVRSGGAQELNATIAQSSHGSDDVVRGERHVLHAGAAVEVQVLINLRLLLA